MNLDLRDFSSSELSRVNEQLRSRIRACLRWTEPNILLWAGARCATPCDRQP